MMIRDVASFRRFVDCDGRPIYMDAHEMVVRVNKASLINALRIAEPSYFVAYKPTAHSVIIHAIGNLKAVEKYNG